MRPAPRLVSVTIPVLDAEEHLADQLEALAGQSYAGDWEVVVVDNGCRDRSMAVARSFERSLPALTIADASSRRGINRARNAGALAARGDFLAFCDADDVAAPGWLAAMADGARHGDLVAGALEFEALNDATARALTPWEPPGALEPAYGFLATVPGGNCGVWAWLARRLRWDEAFDFGNSDIEFAWRAQLESCRLHFAPGAVMHQRLKRDLGALARQHYAYGKSDPKLYRRFRHRGMPAPGSWDALDGWRDLAAGARRHRSPDVRARWVRFAARRAGRVVGSVRDRTLTL